jgi:GGDEF domain-containing protein
MALPKVLFLGCDRGLAKRCAQELEGLGEPVRVDAMPGLLQALANPNAAVVIVDAEESNAPLMQYLRTFLPEVIATGRHVLVLSSCFDRKEEALALEAGAWAVLQKPIDPQLLRVHFRRALAARGPALTGLEAIAKFDPWRMSAQRRLEQCVAQGSGFGVLVSVVTALREVNERKGAQCGDQLLQRFVQRAQGELGPQAIAGRRHGATFVFFVPGENFESVHARARCVAKVRAPRLDYEVESPVSVAGLIWREDPRGADLEQMVESAIRAARALGEEQPGTLALRVLR